jgi:mannosyl-3-phosphoglycerate phosphatase
VLPTNLVVFTDLDGTLLDHHSYSWAAAEEALAELQRRRVPLVFVTSKTRAEVEVLQRKMGWIQPFITENGGGIFLPHGYFPQHIEGATRIGRYHCIALARPYAEIVEELEAIAEEAEASIVGFQQMSAREIAQNTGLQPKQAELARQREFDEPFFFAGAGEEHIQRFVHVAKRRGIEITRGGRFWHAFSGSDKGKAVQKLMKLYRTALHSRQRSVGLGDSANDLPMLAAVDVAVVVQRPDGAYDHQILKKLPRVVRAPGPGPEGWNEAVLQILRDSSPRS